MIDRARACLAHQRVAVLHFQHVTVAHQGERPFDRDRRAQRDLDRAVAAKFLRELPGEPSGDVAAVAGETRAVEADGNDQGVVHQAETAAHMRGVQACRPAKRLARSVLRGQGWPR